MKYVIYTSHFQVIKSYFFPKGRLLFTLVAMGSIDPKLGEYLKITIPAAPCTTITWDNAIKRWSP